MHVTLNAILPHTPGSESWEKLLCHLGKTQADDEPLLLSTILESNGLDDTLWWLRALPDEWDNAVRLLVCDLVEPALVHTDDPRPAEAVRIGRSYAKGEAAREELDAARVASWDAAVEARGAGWYVAADAADAAAGAAAGYADAGYAAHWAAKAAVSTAILGVRNVVRDEQERTLRAWLEKHEEE